MRRNKLLGDWAAEKMGVNGVAVEACTEEGIASDFDESGEDDVLRKDYGDLEAKGVDIGEHLSRREVCKFLKGARDQLSE